MSAITLIFFVQILSFYYIIVGILAIACDAISLKLMLLYIVTIPVYIIINIFKMIICFSVVYVVTRFFLFLKFGILNELIGILAKI